jgi:transcription initiation factor IIE alpha subunit
MRKPVPFLLPPGATLSIALYRCPNCSVAFGQETTVAGPRHCPACGAAFGEETATLNCTPEQLARLASNLKMDPTELHKILVLTSFAVRMFGR